MYCKLYIHCASIDTIISVLEKYFGKTNNRIISTYYFPEFDISIHKNKEADMEKIHIFPDGFLYYENIADIEIYSNYIEITDSILRFLWKHNIPTVASCDYEQELNKLALQK